MVRRRMVRTLLAVGALGAGLIVGALDAGASGPTGFGLPVTSAPIPAGGLGGIAVDRGGNVYVTDYLHGAVLVNRRGTTSWTALPTDGLVSPLGIAVDAYGTVYVTNYDRSILSLPVGATTWSTVISNLAEAPYSIAVDPDGSRVWAAYGNGSDDQVLLVTQRPGFTFTLNALPAISPQPERMALAEDPSGNLFIADAGNDRLLELPAANTGALRTVATGPFTTNDGFFGGIEESLASDGAGNLFIGTGEQSILEYHQTDGSFVRVGPGGSFSVDELAADVAGNVYAINPREGTMTEFPVLLPTGSMTTDRAQGVPGTVVSAVSSSPCPAAYTDGVTLILDNSGATVVTTSPAHLTDNSGDWAGTITIPATAAPGSYFVTAQCTSQGLDLQNSNDVAVTVNQPPPRATQLVAASEKRANPTTFSATLTADGSPVPGKLITFTTPKNSRTLTQCTATTNASGVATCTGQNAFALSGKRAYTASFAGDGSFLPSTATGTLHS